MKMFKSLSSSYLTPPSPPPLLSKTLVDEVGHDEVDCIDDGNAVNCYEQARLESFVNWPLSYMEPGKLAAAGFFYTGKSDIVRCFECYVELCQWLEEDDPMVDHQRWSGRCRFIRQIPCGNVPIGVNPNTIPPIRTKGWDVCGPYGEEYRPGSGPDSHIFSTELQFSSGAHPEYANYDARLCSFESWPKAVSQTKQQLADAGFYYAGKEDQTLCYHCGGGLKDWELEDDPWEQHAKWFPKCRHLLMVKGQKYINKIIGQHG